MAEMTSLLQERERKFLGTIDILNLVYIAVVGILVVVFYQNQDHALRYILIHAALFVVILAFLKLTQRTRRSFLLLLRDWYTPLLFIFFYEETEVLNQLLAPLYYNHVTTAFANLYGHFPTYKNLDYLDPLLEWADHALFGLQPSLAFYRTFNYPLMSEFMHFAYFFYYLLIPILGFTLYLKGRRKEFDLFLFKVALTMYCCYVFFIAFPSSGPKYYFPEAIGNQFHGYVFVWIMEFIFRYGEIANGAFPSSHVAMATVILLCAFQYEKVVFWFFLPMIISLYMSTVYLQAHYLVDVPSGVVVGIFFFAIGGKVKGMFERRFPRFSVEGENGSGQPEQSA
jgi:membrane-associated phospholipid phosphatase